MSFQLFKALVIVMCFGMMLLLNFWPFAPKPLKPLPEASITKNGDGSLWVTLFSRHTEGGISYVRADIYKTADKDFKYHNNR